ncbi:hypothetical protein SAMN05661080_01775 [Modestobacter sp. DSM 44400]|uniref:hypothetical protein n=1 Tax=Modestobacter sp. DSM 44400 TaxID=1550230 RepID=UPI000894C9AF|nr:hypothetical protein [Modestobacter sp. DSM 44400]SDX93992.1 hypothetical protein SAMN05661080_01775 [Modestobacter sp. DSM 44400]
MHLSRTATAIAALAVTGIGVTAGPAAAAPGGPADDPRVTYIVTVAPGTAPAAVAHRAEGIGGRSTTSTPQH